MKTHQIINNVGCTVKTFTYEKDWESWWNTKQIAGKLAQQLSEKHKEYFGVVINCKSEKPFLKLSKKKYQLNKHSIMKLKNEKLWNEHVEKNKGDAYGGCCIKVAKRVMELLEVVV